MFSFGEVDDQVIRDQIACLCREQMVLSDRIRSLRPVPRAMHLLIDEARLKCTCRVVARWLDRAHESIWRPILEVFQIAVVATREQTMLRGTIPLDL
jgi:hypothetical protein